MKYLMPAALLLCCTVAAHAQDTIYYTKSAPILVKLEEINPGKVKYKIWEYQDGPSYVMPRRDIARVATADGKVIWVNEKQWDRHNDEQVRKEREMAPTPVRRKYPRNIIGLSPICFLTSSTGGVLSYERINKSGNTGLRLAVVGTVDYPGAYFIPSVRIYPFGQRVGSPFIAPSLFMGYGKHDVYIDSMNVYGNKDTYTKPKEEFQMGFFIDGGVNLHLTKRIIGYTTIGFGIDYIALSKNINEENRLFAKFEVGFAYRF